MTRDARRIIYCHCAYARVVPPEVKTEVLAKLTASGVDFDAIPDLCELSARRDPALRELASEGGLQIVACYPRAVSWLFSAAEAPLPKEGVEVLNMREQPAQAILHSILGTAG